MDPITAVLGDDLRYFHDEYSAYLASSIKQAEAYGTSAREDFRFSIDLMHLTRLLAEKSPDAEFSLNLDELMDAIDRFVVYSNNDGVKPNSFGVAVGALGPGHHHRQRHHPEHQQQVDAGGPLHKQAGRPCGQERPRGSRLLQPIYHPRPQPEIVG